MTKSELEEIVKNNVDNFNLLKFVLDDWNKEEDDNETLKNFNKNTLKIKNILDRYERGEISYMDSLKEIDKL